MNILVTGANGQLGKEIQLVARGSKDNYIFTDIAATPMKLDITDADTIKQAVKTHHIQCIINCAAYTDVNKAEDDADRCRQLNAQAVRNLAAAIKEVDGLLVHISTDYVFGGNPCNTPCREDQPCAPTSVYGQTKLQGEQHIRHIGCHHIIIRTAWLYSEYGHNFVKNMLQLTADKPQLKVVFDQCGTPTYAYDLAATICDIIENRKYTGNSGTYHYSNEGVCSWYDFAKAIARYAGHTACDILPCHSDEYPSKVKRPAYSVLDKTKIKQTFSIQVPHWTDSLQKCLQNLLAQQ